MQIYTSRKLHDVHLIGRPWSWWKSHRCFACRQLQFAVSKPQDKTNRLDVALRRCGSARFVDGLTEQHNAKEEEKNVALAKLKSKGLQ